MTFGICYESKKWISVKAYPLFLLEKDKSEAQSSIFTRL